MSKIITFLKRIIRYSFGKSYEEEPGQINLKYGLYLSSFCDSLRLCVLAPYRLVISNLEKSLLKEHYLNVTFLQTHLEFHFLLFDSIVNLLKELQRKQLHGCQIIDLVYKYSLSGNMIIKVSDPSFGLLFNKLIFIFWLC